jgi:hypothetical protein
MNDERFLRDWLHDTTDSTTDPNAAADRLVAQISASPQRRRWLPWPPARRPKPDEPNGRTRLMLSPAQAILAGALTLAVSGFMLVAAPFADTEISPPGAEGYETGELSAFEGFIPYGSGQQLAEKEFLENGIVANREQIWRITNADTTDDRFGGTITNTWNWDEYVARDGASVSTGHSIWVGGWLIENDGGGWHERPSISFSFPDETFPVVTTVFDGVGGYDGLTAIVEVTEGAGGFFLRGVITDGPLPPVPSVLQEVVTE